MPLNLAPQRLRSATCHLQTDFPCTARVRPYLNIGCTNRPRYQSAAVRPQLRSVGVIAFATDSKQVGKAAVGPFRQLTLWTAVDAAATIGSIAGAVAFLITSEAVLAGIPVVLPLVAWYAGRQKEGLQVEAAIQRAATQWPVQSMTPSSAADNVASALQQLQRDSQQQQIITKHVKSVEAKLNALEGSVVTAGMNAQDAARQVSSCSDQVAQRTQAQIKDFTSSIQSNGLAALQRLDARLTSLGDSLARLEKAQEESVEHGQQEILDALSQAESSLQDAMERGNQETSEAVRALPNAMTAALSAALQKADQPMRLPSTDQALNGQPAFQVSSLASESQQQLRLLVAEELARAVQQINSAQAQAMQAQPPQSALNQAVLDRLSQIEQQLQKGLVSPSSSGNQVEMPEVLQAMQGLEERLMRSLDQKLADLNVNRSAEEGDPSLSTAAADTAAGPADGDGRTSEPSTSSVQSVHQQHREEEGEEESKQAAYERMQSLLKSRNSSNTRASISGQDDTTPLTPVKESNAREQSGGAGRSGNRQSQSSPSSVQQQFAFAAGLAAAEDVPIATPAETTKLSRFASPTEFEQLPAEQDQLQDQELDQQSSAHAAYQSPPVGSTSGQVLTVDGQTSDPGGPTSTPKGQLPGNRSQQDGQLHPGDDPEQQTDLSQQEDDQSQPDQRGEYTSHPDMAASASGNTTVSSGSGSNGSSGNAFGEDVSSAEAEMVDIEEMSFGERLQAGLDCFRAGRTEAEQGSLGNATRLMTSALSYYEAAAEQDSGSIQLLGNWGNALLAYGSLKKKVLSAVSSAAVAGPADQPAVAAAQAKITQEASTALIAAGQKFQAIAQQDIKNTSALHNWAKSICIRASLKDNPEDAMRLYSSAIDKCDQVLEMKPRDPSVLVTFGLALKDMALCMTLDDPDVQLHLADALDAFQQALEVDPRNKAASVGQAECNDRMRICQKYNEQAGSLATYTQ